MLFRSDAIIHVFLNAGGSNARYHNYSLSWNKCGDEKLMLAEIANFEEARAEILNNWANALNSNESLEINEHTTMFMYCYVVPPEFKQANLHLPRYK